MHAVQMHAHHDRFGRYDEAVDYDESMRLIIMHVIVNGNGNGSDIGDGSGNGNGSKVVLNLQDLLAGLAL